MNLHNYISIIFTKLKLIHRRKIIMRVFTTFTIGFFYLFTSIVFANLSDLNPYKGMALIHEGIYPMGSYKSLKELRPGDLFNTDRHALGPENPAHNVYIDSFYIDIFEVTNSSYMEFVKATESRKPLFWKTLISITTNNQSLE